MREPATYRAAAEGKAEHVAVAAGKVERAAAEGKTERVAAAKRTHREYSGRNHERYHERNPDHERELERDLEIANFDCERERSVAATNYAAMDALKLKSKNEMLVLQEKHKSSVGIC